MAAQHDDVPSTQGRIVWARLLDVAASGYVLSRLVYAVWDLRPASVRASRCLARRNPWYRCPDLADHQWRALSNAAFPLILSALAHLCISHAVRKVRPRWWGPVTAVFGVALVTVLHGGGAVVLLGIAAVCYGWTQAAPVWAVLPVVWVALLSTLLALDRTHGLQGVQRGLGVGELPQLARWEVHFNLTLLRLVSYAQHVVATRRQRCPSNADDAGALSNARLSRPTQDPLHPPHCEPDESTPTLPNTAHAIATTQPDAQHRLRRRQRAAPSTKPEQPAVRDTEPLPDDASRAPPDTGTLVDTAAEHGPALFWAYILYPPLYLAGPIISYPDFVEAVAQPPQSGRDERGSAGWGRVDPGTVPDDCDVASETSSLTERRRSNAKGQRSGNDHTATDKSSLTEHLQTHTEDQKSPPALHAASARAIAWYALRLCFALVIFEVMTRYLQPWTVGRVYTAHGSRLQLSPGGFYGLVFYTLMAIWLKFIVIWRFHRLWALLDGVSPPENMTRCIARPCGIKEFWQGWHVSFHRWLVAHVYIPLGGSRHGSARTAGHKGLVFLFVAFWHDRNTRMLFWGPLLALAVGLETLIERATAKTLGRQSPIMQRAIRAGGRATAASALIIVNMLGFSVGKDLLREHGHASVVATGDFLLAVLCAGWLSDPALLRGGLNLGPSQVSAKKVA